nr:MAG TPA: hypothetical protein [Caudoviricetes sp.]
MPSFIPSNSKFNCLCSNVITSSFWTYLFKT